MNTHVLVYGHKHTHTHTHTCTQAHTHTQTHTHIHTHMHTSTHTQAHTHKHTYMHAHSHISWSDPAQVGNTVLTSLLLLTLQFVIKQALNGPATKNKKERRCKCLSGSI